MIDPIVHECPDGSTFRISRIQALRSDPCFDGVVMTYLVEPESRPASSDEAAAPEGGEDAAAGESAGGESGAGAPEGDAEPAGPAPGFRVVVRFAPIFVSILSPDDRRRLEARAGALIERLLDRGVREDTRVEVTSDGAVRLDGEVVERELPLGRGAA